MDEPTNGELARGIADLKIMLGALVSRAEYEAWRQGIDFRFGELTRQADAERTAREADIKELHGRITLQAQSGAEHRMHWRQLVWTGALPAVATLVAAILTYLITSGGH